ncbi:hypothetical protein EYF80_003744 [Liparis tanakae]|uniref:Uncharacterized protein n=1 Tax=Liparis tanakae TaxID=230148 RepID=A0A4Z2J6Y3_9TELE|nr:hypothetical protein EYF80_003744 [Liparis tanakae]
MKASDKPTFTGCPAEPIPSNDRGSLTRSHWTTNTSPEKSAVNYRRGLKWRPGTLKKSQDVHSVVLSVPSGTPRIPRRGQLGCREEFVSVAPVVSCRDSPCSRPVSQKVRKRSCFKLPRQVQNTDCFRMQESNKLKQTRIRVLSKVGNERADVLTSSSTSGAR